MRALGDWPPAVRAVTAVAATCLFMVLVAWATLLGPDQVFTGPGPRPASTSATESCTPLPVRTLPDGTTEVVYPDDYALDSGYCDPPAADARDEAEDIVRQNPPPLWLRLLVRTFLAAFLAGGVALVLWLLIAATLAAYGPTTLAVDPRLARLWLGRGLLALVPVPLTWVALRGLDPAWAPPGTWLATGVLVAALLLVTARLTRSEAR